jgi:hypothetical protein
MRVSWLRRSPLMVMTMVALVAASIGAGSAGGERDTVAVPSSQTKKKCKLVKKKVHAKVRKVRVCTNAKPAPSLPSRVSVTLDTAHAARASVTADSGATVSAGKATLAVPAGAVDKATTVTVTPVKRLAGLGGQLVGAVQLQPGGLRLLRPVTLTIDVPSASGLEAFTSVDNGRNFHLYPLSVEGGKAKLTLFHFTIYGVGKRLPPPSEATLRKGLDKYIRPDVEAAKRSGALSDLSNAVFEYSLWKAEVDQLAPARRKRFAKDVSALEKGLAAALRKLADEQHKVCVSGHKIVETGKKITLARDLVESMLGASALLEAADAYAAHQLGKCERFELDFESTTMLINRSDQVYKSGLRVRNLKLIPDNTWENHAGHDYYLFEFPQVINSVCHDELVSLGYSEPFKATLDPVFHWYSDGDTPRISMAVDVGQPSERIKNVCSNTTGEAPTFAYNYWATIIDKLHGGLRWTIDDWNYVGGSVFAERKYSASKDIGEGNFVRESTTFTLRHTPEP